MCVLERWILPLGKSGRIILCVILSISLPTAHQTNDESGLLTSVFTDVDYSDIASGDKNILHFAKTSFIPKRNKLLDSETSTKNRHKRTMENKLEFSYDDYQDLHYPLYKPLGPKSLLKYNGEATGGHNQNFWKDHSTPEVVRKSQAEAMMNYIDKQVDPCYDFYKYACGNWEAHNPIPPDKAVFDMFEILRENLYVVLRDLLTQSRSNNMEESKPCIELDTQDPENPYTKAKNLYHSCINDDIINERAATPLLVLLKQLKGWPVLENSWSEDEFDLLHILSQLRMFNNDILISEWVGPDVKNSEEYLIQFDQTSLGLPTREFFLLESNVKYLEAYRIYMITVANLLGAQINNATRDADRMIDFETNLARITAPPDKRKNVTELYERMTIGELQAMIPQFDWLSYLKSVTQIDVEPTRVIVCYCISYFQDLMILLSLTPPRTIANYILWRFVRHRVTNLDERFHEAQKRFHYVILGLEDTPPRWQTCVSQVNSHMGMTMGSLFVRKYFNEASKNETIEMTKEIREAFREIVAQSWLDDDTKEIAELKLNAMKLRIGYPDFILSTRKLHKRYSDVKIRRDYYFENILSVLEHLTVIEHERLGNKVDKTIWNTPPAVVNAYYSRNKNQIMFPAGILQPPFYQKSFPRCLNYGGIGVVIGHEITHGFDDKGRLFDQDGNLYRWWRESSILEFHKRAQCLIEQYNSYIVPDVQMAVDGTATHGENIADNGGIRQAFKAYKRWVQKHPEEDETLPGLDLTNQQLFFLNFAQVWCGTSRPEAMRNRIKTAVHAPGQFRVIGTLSNSDDFAKAFNCPIGSPMNPKSKCSIW